MFCFESACVGFELGAPGVQLTAQRIDGLFDASKGVRIIVDRASEECTCTSWDTAPTPQALQTPT
eukprot:6684642-Alexandrium_andersonii.AAC.1